MQKVLESNREQSPSQSREVDDTQMPIEQVMNQEVPIPDVSLAKITETKHSLASARVSRNNLH